MSNINVYVVIFIFSIFCCVLFVGCGAHDKEGNEMVATDQVSTSEWNAFSQRHVVLGHQSVGNNILSGVHALAEKSGVKLQVTETRSSTADSGITHFEIGQNENPTSKLKDFEDTFNSGTLKGVDIALMKLCYIDINNSTDVRKLAQEYGATIDRLSSRFPSTKFIAVTTPLTTVQSGPKAWVKKLLGRTPGGYAENYRRLEFNEIIRNNYGRQGRLFDLAKIESEGVSNYQYQGRSVEMLNPAITSDGGHLSSVGECIIAAKLIKFISALPSPGASRP